MSFARYPSYKDSGVGWLGEVPEHWDVRRLKQVCEVFPSNVDKKTYENESPVLLCNYTDVYYNEKITPQIDFMVATASAEQVKKFTLREGDTIITKDSETPDDIAIAAYVPQNMPGVICGYHLSMVRPREVTCGAFVKRLFDSIYVKSCCAVYANGLTRVGLGQYALDNLEMPFPPVSEQQTIAAFLDRETAKIDALIAEQQRLIELLKEKRQAVISHVVTKGLNPNAPMKDSGIEWLGEVPKYWDVTRLGFLCKKIGSGKTPLGGSETYIDSGVVFIRSQNVYDEGLRLDDVVYISEQTDSEMYWSRVNSGDILLNITGASLGRTCLVPNNFEPANVNQHVCIIRLIEAELGSYIAMVMKSSCLKAQIDAAQTGAAREGLNFGVISKLTFALPPISEQQNIAAFLDRETAKHDTLTAEAKTAITLLQERRTALISAAVTGKIDVRGLFSANPEVEQAA